MTDTLAPRPARSKWSIAYFLLWILPFAGVLAMIHRYGVDVPYWDECDSDVAGLIAHVFTGRGLTWHALMAQHNETRLFCLRVLYLASVCFGPWDTRYAMVASAFTVLLTSAAVFYIARRTIPNRRAALFIALLADYLLFSPAQWQDLLWGIQWIVFVPAAALAVSLALLDSDLRLSLAVALSALAAAISTYSYANGMIVWALLIPSLLIYPDRRRFRGLAVWLVLAGLCIGYYFHDYIKPGGHPPMSLIVHLPIYALEFFLAFLGNGPRFNDHIQMDFLLGALSLGLWLLAIAIVLLKRDRPRMRRALPWIIFGSYTVISAAVTTAGRLGYGVLQANPSRYSTFAIPLWISLLPMWWIALEPSENSPAEWSLAALGGAIALVALHGVIFIQGELGGWVAARRAARAVIQFSSCAPDLGDLGEVVYPDPQKILARLHELNAAHLLRCGYLLSNKIADLPGGAVDSGGGSIETLRPVDGLFRITGWAEDPERKTPPDAVLLTIADSHGYQRVWGIAINDRLNRHKIAVSTGHRWLRYSGWRYSFGADRIPLGSMICAWAYDSIHERAYKLSPPAGVRWPPG